MDNFFILFNDIQNKIAELFNESTSKLDSISKEEKNYLNIIYKLKMTTLYLSRWLSFISGTNELENAIPS